MSVISFLLNRLPIKLAYDYNSPRTNFMEEIPDAYLSIPLLELQETV